MISFLLFEIFTHKNSIYQLLKQNQHHNNSVTNIFLQDLNPRVEADLSFLLEEIKKQCDGFGDNANISLEKVNNF